jgi:nucleotide-binding universal stress UspA family protein
MRHVVCGIHASEHTCAAAGVAATLAHRLGLPLELLHVCQPGSPPDVGLVRAVLDSLDGVFEPGEVVLRLESGDPETRLAQASLEAELLVVGASEEGVLRRALGHDVTSSLARDAAAPLVVVPADGAAERGELPGSAVVCGVRDRRDVVCVRAAAQVAQSLGGPLVLALVVEPPIPTALAVEAMPPTVPQARYGAADALLEECSDAAEAVLAVAPDKRVETGMPGPALVKLARERHAGLLAVGSSSRGPLAAALGGAAARHVLRHAGMPVMVCPHAEAPQGGPTS